MNQRAFDVLVKKVQRKHGKANVPEFEPRNGNEGAKYLFLLESPGPKSLESEYISQYNNDPSANNLKDQLDKTGFKDKEIAIWNIVPWFLCDANGKSRKPNPQDILQGKRYLKQLIENMPKLKVIILVGGEARKAFLFLCTITEARIVTCHHTSALGMKPNQNTKNPRKENLAIFKLIRKLK